MKICQTENCNKQAVKSRNYCHCCRKKKYRESNPIQTAFTNLKQSAKRRGKEFTLTFEQFESFCIKTEYIGKKGRAADSYHIDRKDETKGYTLENIQVLTNSENIKKFLRWNGERKKELKEFKVLTEKEAVNQCPF